MAEGVRVVVVTGIGGMGTAIARRLGTGATLLLADLRQEALVPAGRELRAEGYDVEESVTDVGDAASVHALAEAAAELGRVDVVVHTAGVSPVQAPVGVILRVDLLGTALMLDAFAGVVAAGGAGVFIGSMAGSFAALDADLERRLATEPTSSLLQLPELSEAVVRDPGTAYALAKRANQLRVRGAAQSWGRRRARVNSISPGVISTVMGRAELDGPSGDVMRSMVAASPVGRIGTAQDIAAAAEFLSGPGAAFITGTDLLVDGGVVAAVQTA